MHSVYSRWSVVSVGVVLAVATAGKAQTITYTMDEPFFPVDNMPVSAWPATTPHGVLITQLSGNPIYVTEYANRFAGTDVMGRMIRGGFNPGAFCFHSCRSW